MNKEKNNHGRTCHSVLNQWKSGTVDTFSWNRPWKYQSLSFPNVTQSVTSFYDLNHLQTKLVILEVLWINNFRCVCSKPDLVWLKICERKTIWNSSWLHFHTKGGRRQESSIKGRVSRPWKERCWLLSASRKCASTTLLTRNLALQCISTTL